jgi:diguanylate cyclase (GGDEF)-like protein/PAS domain S-box-containing protein
MQAKRIYELERHLDVMISKIFPAHSISIRVTLVTLIIFVASLWLLEIVTSRTLQHDMERVLGEQQFATVSLAASELSDEFRMRFLALDSFAAGITPSKMANAAALQTLLEQRPVFQNFFNAGTFVTGNDGTAIASLPVSAGRIGINYMDRVHVASALKEGKAIVSHPVIGKQLKVPVFAFSTPIRDTHNKIIGALIGVIDLTKPNFLDHLLSNGYGKEGGYIVTDPAQRLIVAATDKTRIMQNYPQAGTSAVTNRLIEGYEGVGKTTNFTGIEVITASKRIPAAGWFVEIELPTQKAFGPIYTIQQRMLLLAIALTLFSGSLTWWFLRRQLSPMLEAAKTLDSLDLTNSPLQLIPVARQDEIGKLLGSFNSLLENIKQKDIALQQSEERYRTLIEWTPEAVAVHRGGKILFVNQAAIEMMGAKSSQDLVGKPLLELIPKELHSSVLARVKKQAEEGVAVPMLEEKFIRLDGTIIDAEVQATPIMYEGEAAFHVAMRDISERKIVEQALEESSEKYRGLSDAAFEAIFISEKGICIEQNARATEKFGYSDEKAIGRPVTNLIAPEDRDLVMKNMVSGYELPYEVTALRQDGSTFPAIIRARTMRYKGKEAHVTSLRDLSDIKLAEELQRKSEESLRSVIEAIPDLLFEVDLEGRYFSFFSSSTELLAAKPEDFIGRKISDVLPPDASAICMSALRDANDDGYSRGKVIKLYLPNGEKWFELSVARKPAKSNEAPHFIVLSRDISERKEIEAQLLESEYRFRSVMENIPSVAVQGYALDGRVLFWNKAAEKIYGYSIEEALDKNLLDLIIPPEMREDVRGAMLHMVETGEAIPAGELLLKTKDDSRVPVFSSHALLNRRDGRQELFCLDIDMTERKQLEEQVRHLAFFDALTSLPNRRLLDDRLAQVMATSKRSGSYGALMFLDLDNFKPLNDSHGHSIGDLLLIEVASRLKSCVREIDTVARFGGDEFVVLISELNTDKAQSVSQSGVIAEKIRSVLAEPYLLYIPGHDASPASTVEHHCTASIGVVVFVNHEEQPSDILKWADIALYQAKNAGRNSIKFYS